MVGYLLPVSIATDSSNNAFILGDIDTCFHFTNTMRDNGDSHRFCQEVDSASN
jgi:hypothetical protein